MNRRKKLTTGILLAVSTVVAAVELYGGLHFYTRPYPAGNISGYVAWGAGGPTDVVSRALSVYGARELGTSIIIQNKTGASGSVATEFVKRQPADGYSLLFNSENPPLYKVMGLSGIDYDDYYPTDICSRRSVHHRGSPVCRGPGKSGQYPPGHHRRRGPYLQCGSHDGSRQRGVL